MSGSLFCKRSSVAALMLALATPHVCAADQARFDSDEARVESIKEAMISAHQQYALGKYWEAYGNFFWAAIQDHAPAQELLGFMLLYGEDLYGPQVKQDAKEAGKWFKAAASQGLPVAAFMSAPLERRNVVLPAAKRDTATR